MKLAGAIASFTLVANLFAVFVVSQLIQPSSVPLSTRKSWCNQQEEQCPLLCTQINDGKAATTSNTCAPDTLVYSCVCQNGQSPNSTEYSNTIPFFECQTAIQQCNQNCGGSNTCQANCFQQHPCGASDPRRYNITAVPSTTSTAQVTAAPTLSSTNGGSQVGQSLNGNNGGGSGAASLIIHPTVSFVAGLVSLTALLSMGNML